MCIFYCVKVIDINGLTEIQIYYEKFQPLYGSHQAGCSTNKQVLQISPATVSHCSFIYIFFNYYLFCVCVF